MSRFSVDDAVTARPDPYSKSRVSGIVSAVDGDSVTLDVGGQAITVPERQCEFATVGEVP